MFIRTYTVEMWSRDDTDYRKVSSPARPNTFPLQPDNLPSFNYRCERSMAAGSP